MVRIGFVHPDLGIGGAERLIVDAALSLQSRGHQVELYTSHHDPSHCFSETKDGTLVVRAVGDWLPRHCFYRGYALFAYLRVLYVSLYMILSCGSFDVIITDQVSAPNLLFRLFTRSKILFYCHFPDQLLTKRETLLKRLYRWPIDKLEEKTTGLAHKIVVNSLFTRSVFQDTFSSLSHIVPAVLYPSINFSSFDRDVSLEPSLSVLPSAQDQVLFLSINRYERKKNLSLALTSFKNLLDGLDDGEKERVHLVMAGGYDERVVENKEYYAELKQLANQLEISDKVTFIRSFSDTEKIQLLIQCSVLLYTPTNEHFGICPLEAMYMHRPVIAVNTGGPLETVLDGETGFLVDATVEGFSDKMRVYVRDGKVLKSQGSKARPHVIERFSFEAFTNNLNDIIDNLVE